TNVITTPQAFLANNARINGALQTTTAPTLQQGAAVTGGTVTNAQLTPASVVPWTPPPPATGNDFILNPDATGSITAGSYRDVIINARARVTFGPGTYAVRTLDLEPQSIVTFDNRTGPIIIYVDSNLIGRAAPNVLGGAAKMLIVLKGSNGAAFEAPFAGT